MDIILLCGIAISLLLVLISIFFYQRSQNTPNKQPDDHPHQRQRGVPGRVQEGIPRRAQIARNQRNRLRNVQIAGGQNDDDDLDDEILEGENTQVTDEKMGAKKRAKVEAKAQKRASREADLQSREDKKKKEALIEEEKKREEEKAAIEARKKEQAELLEREKQEREEHEAYLKMKAGFTVEEEGFLEGETEEQDTLLQDFIQYIKDNKVVVLEDLATHFKLKTKQAIDRILELQKNNTLTGVIDDRGKFIYVSEDELKSVAKFIRQRGRISITELAESSNNLINLAPISTS